MASSFPFSLEGEKKRLLFSLAGYVVNSPILHLIAKKKIHSSSIFHRIICGPFWGSFAVLYSTISVKNGIYKGKGLDLRAEPFRIKLSATPLESKR